MLHHSLFIYFNREGGHIDLINFFLHDTNLEALNSSQHLLRYLTYAIIVHKENLNLISDLTMIVLNKKLNPMDPFTKFIDCLNTNLNPVYALDVVIECEKAINNDIFLHKFKNEFSEAAKGLIFGNCCNLFLSIETEKLFGKFGKIPTLIRRWISSEIGNQRIDSKFDSQLGLISKINEEDLLTYKISKKIKTILGRISALNHSITTRI